MKILLLIGLGFSVLIFVVAQAWKQFEITLNGWWILRGYRIRQSDSEGRYSKAIDCTVGWINSKNVTSVKIEFSIGTCRVRLSHEAMHLARLLAPITLDHSKLRATTETRRGSKFFGIESAEWVCLVHIDRPTLRIAVPIAALDQDILRSLLTATDEAPQSERLSV